ncbi:MAG: clostripain-related cysteine peptidase [Clostridiales bacterium]|nr:clostripain-related cysteine peptidase [Clostridiales bacterium]
MNYNNLCYNCMHEKRAAAMPCPFCGAPPGMNYVPGLLEPQTILRGRYLLGNMKGQRDQLIEYIALDLGTESVVTVYEFYLPDQMRRSTRFPGWVRLLVETPENRRLFEEQKRRIREEAEIQLWEGRLPILQLDYFEENGTIYTIWTNGNEKAPLQSNSVGRNTGMEDRCGEESEKKKGWKKPGKCFGGGEEKDSDGKKGRKPGRKKIVMAASAAVLGLFLLLGAVLFGRYLILNDGGIFSVRKETGTYGDPDAEDEYTLMVYMVGSNLESDYGAASADLMEMLYSGVDCSKVNVLIYTGGSSSWEMDAISSEHNSVFLMTGEGELYEDGSTSSSVNMGSASTLAAFLSYCQESYPAQHYALILWDHGNGAVNGFGNDELYGYDPLYLSEMKEALENSLFGEERKLDWVGYDACLMASLEVANVWKDYVGYLVASEEVESGSSWDYSFLSVLNDTDDPLVISERIIDSYADYYESESSVLYDPVTTLSCLDLERMDTVLGALDAVLERMTADVSDGEYSKVAQVRAAAKQFGIAVTSGRENAYDAVDLGDLAELLQELYPSAAKRLSNAMERMVVDQTSNIASTSGVTLYFPFDNMERFADYGEAQYEDLLDEAYADFIAAFTDHRLNGESETDWTLASIEVGESELTLQLTEEQAEDLAYASFSILRQTENRYYTPVRSGCVIWPDEDGILRLDMEQYVLVLENSEISVEWPVEQLEETGSEELYINKAAYVQYSDEENTVAVTVSLCLDTELGTASVRSLYSSEVDSGIVPDGKTDQRLEDYMFLSCESVEYSPSFNSQGDAMPWEKWKVSGRGMLTSICVDETFAGYVRSTSESEGTYIVQIELQDTSGTVHASGFVTLP